MFFESIIENNYWVPNFYQLMTLKMEGPVPIGLNWTVHQLLYIFQGFFYYPCIFYIFTLSGPTSYYMCAMYVCTSETKKKKKLRRKCLKMEKCQCERGNSKGTDCLEKIKCIPPGLQLLLSVLNNNYKF